MLSVLGCAGPCCAAYDLTNGGKPFYSTWLVGRSVLNGGVMWTKSMNASGWSQLPVSRPTVHLGVASLVTGSQVVVMEAGSGSTRFVYSAGGRACVCVCVVCGGGSSSVHTCLGAWMRGV